MQPIVLPPRFVYVPALPPHREVIRTTHAFSRWRLFKICSQINYTGYFVTAALKSCGDIPFFWTERATEYRYLTCLTFSLLSSRNPNPNVLIQNVCCDAGMSTVMRTICICDLCASWEECLLVSWKSALVVHISRTRTPKDK